MLEFEQDGFLPGCSNLSRMLETYGDLRSFDDTHDETVFVAEFYDDRAAERAVANLDGAIIDGSRLSCKLGSPSKTRPKLLSSPPMSPGAFPAWSPLNRGPSSLNSPASVPPFFWDQQAVFGSVPLTPATPASSLPSARFISPLPPPPPPPCVSPGHFRRASTSAIPSQWHVAPPPYQPTQSLSVVAQPSSPQPINRLSAFSPRGWPEIDNLSLGPRLDSGLPSPAPNFSLFAPPPAPAPAIESTTPGPGPTPGPGHNVGRVAPQQGHSRGRSLGSISGSYNNGGSSGSRPPASMGLVREDKIPVNNQIDQRKLEAGTEVRTTIMLKNLPNKLGADEVMAYVDSVFSSSGSPGGEGNGGGQVKRAYDGFYLRIDFAQNNNVGYAFINFLTLQLLLTFLRAKVGTRYNLAQSDKICSATWANIQGRESFIDHFRNSAIMDQPDAHQPRIFYSDGPNQGRREPFPGCTDPLRKMRSSHNQKTHGLFPAQKPDFKLRPERLADAVEQGQESLSAPTGPARRHPFAPRQG